MDVIVRAVTAPESVSFHAWTGEALDELGYRVVSLSSPGDTAKWLDRRYFDIVEVPMQRHISPVKDLRSLWKVYRVIRRLRPVMVHSMTPKAGLLCMMAAWAARVPVRVHTFTGLVFPTSTGLKKRILMFTDRLTCACATHVIPEGEGVRSDLLSNAITRKDIRVLGYGNVNGIDLKRFDPDDAGVQAQAARLRKDGVFTYVFVGRLVGDKGIRELVSAYSRLHAEHPATRLVLVGRDEPELDPLDAETSRIIDSDSSIEAVGQQSDVRPWLAAADVNVLPSYREGFPNVVIEAGAMGLPSVVTDINGSREIVSDGENGLIVKPHDADSLYRAMERLYTDRTLTASMAAKSRPMIASRFECSYVRGCLIDYYRQILPPRNNRP